MSVRSVAEPRVRLEAVGHDVARRATAARDRPATCRPSGRPPPPRPRRPASPTMRMSVSGARSAVAVRQAVQAPARSAAARPASGSYAGAPSRTGGQPFSPARMWAAHAGPPCAWAARRAVAMAATALGRRIGQPLAVERHDARGRRRLAAAIGRLEAHGAVRAACRRRRAEVLPRTPPAPVRRRGTVQAGQRQTAKTWPLGRLEAEVGVGAGRCRRARCTRRRSGERCAGARPPAGGRRRPGSAPGWSACAPGR